MSDDAQNEQLRQIFLSDYVERRDTFLSLERPRFAHYTSAETAIKIIKNKEVWLRSATLMNDFSEILHGQDCLAHSWHRTPAGKQLRSVMGTLHVDAEQEFANAFDEDQADQRMNSYMVCISEHANMPWHEDMYGRLSMWRAYGGPTNVALVLSSAPFFAENDSIGAYTSPVLYADREEFARAFSKFVDSLANNIGFLKPLGWQVVRDYLFWRLRSSVLSTKHPGFAEEREWRVIYSPKLYPQGTIKKSTEVIAGVPQTVYKLPLEDTPGKEATGLEIKDLLDRVIIGPTPYSYDIATAIADALGEAGVQDPWSKLIISNIPLRR